LNAPDDAIALADQRDAFVDRLFKAALGMFDVVSVSLGDRLGLYRALADGDAATPPDLAARTGTHPRYVREWLEQQAVTGILVVDDPDADPDARRYALPPAHAEVLLDHESLAYFAPSARLLVASMRVLPAVETAFREGGGVPYAAYGADAHEAIADGNRPLFRHLLGQNWLPSIPDVHARLLAEPPARVADVGCGQGWSSLAIARAYPTARVDGFDLDGPSIERARQNADEAGLADRVRFEERDAADPMLAGNYDLAIAFECIHDMARPVDALRAMHGLVGENGAVVIVDERVAESFAAPGEDMDRLFYGISLLHCLPVGMAEQPSAGTGTVMRPAKLGEYATEAGFRGVEILPIENDFWRFYRLVS
jgi:2-polyprenyl-3-methyl-5-hydroxy-6-metoxy-1,4-benzoquinol methylase